MLYAYRISCTGMAKVQFGILASEIRAKIGGVVYSRVRGTAVVRVKVIPKNPKTAAQTAIRTAFSAVGKAWFQTLTEDQRQTWLSFANLFAVRDRLGQTIFLTGHMWFMRLNRPLQFLGLPLLTLPPGELGAQQIPGMTITANSVGASNLTVTFATRARVTTQIFFWATELLSPGRNNFKPFLRVISNQPGSPILGTNIFSSYVSKFGTPVAGKAIAVQSHWLNTLNGVISVPFIQKVIWGA